jgi:hypothetical protein
MVSSAICYVDENPRPIYGVIQKQLDSNIYIYIYIYMYIYIYIYGYFNFFTITTNFLFLCFNLDKNT